MFGSRGFSPYGAYALGSVAKSGINWSNLLSNTQKTLGIINQAIPAFYQIKPIFNNMKTMFKVVNEINRDTSETTNTNNYSKTIEGNSTNINNVSSNEVSNSYAQEDAPTFFV